MSKHRKDITWDKLRGIAEDNGARPEDLDRLDVVISRRRFFGQVGALAGLATFGPGADAVLRGVFGRGLIPAAWAQEADAEAKSIPGKPGMIVHNTRPINGEFPPHLLNDDVTPTERHFVRNNGLVPERAQNQDPQGWEMIIDGEVHRPLRITLDDLQRMPSVTMPFVIECAGNGRAFFDPAPRGNPWRYGAVACSEWTGVRLRDLLKEAGLKNSAVYTGHYGEDPPLAGDKPPISRGIPIDKAMEEHTLIAYKMNGQNLSTLNGYPARIVVPGWIGSASQKWLTRIWIRDQVHDGPKMTGYSYRTPAYPVVPGSKPAEEDMVILTSWRIKSMITQPMDGAKFSPGQRINVNGHAWAGENAVKSVLVSTDYGITWHPTTLRPPANKYAWYHWHIQATFPQKGYYEIWARAVDDEGNTQPFAQAPWNPRGYMGNMVHRLPVRVGV